MENDNYATNVSFIAELVPTRPRLILRNASAYFIVYARGSIASERVATFNGSMLISGNAGMIQEDGYYVMARHLIGRLMPICMQ